MYSSGPAPTDQRPGVKPIVFVLDDGQSLEAVTLPIRPEDLTRSEGARATVHQTLGRDITGWVDNFGELLPSCTISGNTGWRVAAGIGRDGFQSFEDLNNLIQKRYHAAKQSAIDSGRDPAIVKLLFVDALDHFAWSVVPTQFSLRRSKSRPLLFQYNITLQALATTIDIPDVQIPNYGNNGAGMTSLQAEVDNLQGLDEPGIWDDAVGSWVSDFMTSAIDIVDSALNAISAATAGVNRIIGQARDIAQSAMNVFRVIGGLASLPAALVERAAMAAAAFSSVVCIFTNSLRPRGQYEDYSGLYGASNCSSTTGGSPMSAYSGQNVFALMHGDALSATATSAALFAVQSLRSIDPVLAPPPISEVARHAQAVVAGAFA